MDLIWLFGWEAHRPKIIAASFHTKSIGALRTLLRLLRTNYQLIVIISLVIMPNVTVSSLKKQNDSLEDEIVALKRNLEDLQQSINRQDRHVSSNSDLLH